MQVPEGRPSFVTDSVGTASPRQPKVYNPVFDSITGFPGTPPHPRTDRAEGSLFL